MYVLTKCGRASELIGYFKQGSYTIYPLSMNS